MEWVKSLELLNLPLMMPYTIPVTAQSIKIIATIDCITGALKRHSRKLLNCSTAAY